ncbi:hypothetical protein HQ520_10690 [bacterium]|nr:hypothetical protein [bacterium]
MRKYAIAVMSLDRIGIINNVTGAILSVGGNIDKMSQTVMDGCFTILITARFPDEATLEIVGQTITKGRRAVPSGRERSALSRPEERAGSPAAQYLLPDGHRPRPKGDCSRDHQLFCWPIFSSLYPVCVDFRLIRCGCGARIVDFSSTGGLAGRVVENTLLSGAAFF